MQKRRRQPKLRRLRRAQTAFPRLQPIGTGILGEDFLWELNHQLHARNDPEAHRRAGHLWMLDLRSDASSGADRKFRAHVDAVLKMYGAPSIGRIPGSDEELEGYNRAAWRHVAKVMLADILSLDDFEAERLVKLFGKLMGLGDNPLFRYETAARHLACVLVNTQHPGLRGAERTGRPNRWSPVRLSQLLLDREAGKAIDDRQRLHDAQNPDLNPLAPYVLGKHEDKVLCEAVRDTVQIMGRRVRKRNP